MATVQKELDKWQPDWVALRILDFARKVHEFGNDDKALAEWTRQMSEDLIFNNTSSEDEFTQNLLAEASDAYAKKSKAGRKGGIAKARNQKQKSQEVAGNGAASKSPTSCDQFTADGDIREDSLAKPDGSAITRNETRANDALEPSANIYGDAATREGAEVVDSRESGAAVPTTVSRNMRRVPQNEAPAHGFSGGRTAQGTISRSPEAAAQSGKAYDQAPDKVSTNNGDAARREAADGDTTAAARTTVSNPLALDMPKTDKASNPRGYNTADVPPSYGPEDGTIDNPVTPAGSSHPAGNTPPQFVISHNQRHRPQKPQANSPPRSSEDVRLFALDRNLDIDDARMWYQMNFVDRPGCDKDGVAINNWKGHCTAYCKAEAERRKAG